MSKNLKLNTGMEKSASLSQFTNLKWKYLHSGRCPETIIRLPQSL
jgi:hypothetical protein